MNGQSESMAKATRRVTASARTGRYCLDGARAIGRELLDRFVHSMVATGKSVLYTGQRPRMKSPGDADPVADDPVLFRQSCLPRRPSARVDHAAELDQRPVAGALD